MPAQTIAKGETLSFATQYPNQPVDAVTLKYIFAGDEDDLKEQGDSRIETRPGDQASLLPQE